MRRTAEIGILKEKIEALEHEVSELQGALRAAANGPVSAVDGE